MGCTMKKWLKQKPNKDVIITAIIITLIIGAYAFLNDQLVPFLGQLFAGGSFTILMGLLLNVPKEPEDDYLNTEPVEPDHEYYYGAEVGIDDELTPEQIDSTTVHVTHDNDERLLCELRIENQVVANLIIWKEEEGYTLPV